MTPEQIDGVLIQLRTRMAEEPDDATFTEMRQVYQALRVWVTADQPAPMPYPEKLQEWGIGVDGETSAEAAPFEALSGTDETGQTTLDSTAEVAPISLPEGDVTDDILQKATTPEQVEPAAETDPDDGLQEAYEEAVALLGQERYYAARAAFTRLGAQARGRLQGDIYRYLGEAREKLDIRVQERIERAQNHSEKQPNDLVGQRKLWDKVLEADPDNDAAKAALADLGKTEERRRVQEEIVAIRQNAADATANNRLTELNRILGRAETLQQTNRVPELRLVIDDLVADVTRQRAEARGRLGRASTLAVSGNTREAYRQAQEYITQGLREVYDEAGILGKADAEVNPSSLVEEARRRFFDQLRDLTQQRLSKADGEKGPSPAIAQETLLDTQLLLTDPILTKEDREELLSNLGLVERALAEVNERLARFEKAREKVLAAGTPGTEEDDKHRLYREARELYPEYPDIEVFIQEALRAIANREATGLLDQMTLSRRQLEQDHFEAALTILQKAREHARRRIPELELGSELDLRLREVAGLEQEIIVAEGAYKRMLSILENVDNLLSQYEQEKQASLLVTVRSRLEQLSDAEKVHPETRKRRARFIELQGVEESWEEGKSHYHLWRWNEAIPLLERVAKSDSPERNEAVYLLNRAQATLHVLEARQAEIERKYGDARLKYQTAADRFQTYNADVYTEEFERSARGALERLRSLSGNDNTVKQALQLAQTWLGQAADKVKARSSQLGQVEEVEEFQKSVNALQSVRHLETTLALDLETTLSQARQQWLEAYRIGMQAGRRSDDLVLLRKAVNLGQVLKEHDLLYEKADKELWRQVQEKYLDAEWQQLKDNAPSIDSLQAEIERLQRNPEMNKVALREKQRELNLLQQDPMGASALIEDNRRRRLEIAGEKTDTLQEQYQAAMAQRVRFRLGQEQQKGLSAAINFLRAELNKPELYQNLELFEELLHLLWQSEDWPEAEQRAVSLRYRQLPRAQEISELWVGLTKGAKLLADGNLEQFRAEMLLLEKGSPEASDAMLLARQEIWLKEWRVNKLLQQVSQQSGEREDGQIVQAQLYAEAHQLAPADIRVQTGLRQLGRQLGHVLGIKCRQAQHLSLTQSLDFSLQEARKLQVTLLSIQGIAEALTLNREQKEEIQTALDKLERTIRPWQHLQTQLAVVEQEKNIALAHPSPIQGQEEGGWLLKTAEARLREARSSVNQTDRELARLLTDKAEELTRLSTAADECNNVVRALRIALVEEDFMVVMEKASELERLWPARQVDGFDGLYDLLRYADPFQKGREIRRPDEHRKRAQQQQNNLEAWQNWALKVKQEYEQVKKTSTIFSKPLDDLVHDKSLHDIAAVCREIQTQCQVFEIDLLARPEIDPLSNCAAVAQGSINSTWEVEVLDAKTGYRGKAAERLDGIDNKMKKMDKHLRDLRTAMQQAERLAQPTSGIFGIGTKEPNPNIVRQWLGTAKRHLQKCSTIDPLHEEVVGANRRIRELEEKFGETR